MPTELGASVGHLNNRFAWFGVDKPFDTLTQTFIETGQGALNAHHYRYAPDRSTFIVEMNADTFENMAFAEMNDKESAEICARLFAETLEGRPLVCNNSIWRQFPLVHNKRWSHGKYVILGDALHTAHFSIGSGTRLAMEDAIALGRALAAHKDVREALTDYEAARKPILEKLVTGANTSADWYEHFADHMKLAPAEFAMSYITRSGRVDLERLRKLSPRFVAWYESQSK